MRAEIANAARGGASPEVTHGHRAVFRDILKPLPKLVKVLNGPAWGGDVSDPGPYGGTDSGGNREAMA
ncbi:hypothetical protein GCM10023194_48550 [Planotetraspora phitsanulokensis]|uniref:Uncharacterized protein n=1 Tax=Planotetraspora phitsanulokensis TaxID=575192 RepID=A0A8J3XJL4_9ACTN|nr:hypothetical protein Pph01_71590 [Planotetraspora phitsanulokensis]